MGTTDEMARIRQFSCLQDNFGVLVHLPESGRTIALYLIRFFKEIVFFF